MAKRDSSPQRNAAPSPNLAESYGPATSQPTGFARGTVDAIGCMAGDWSISTARTISGADPSEPKKSRGGY